MKPSEKDLLNKITSNRLPSLRFRQYKTSTNSFKTHLLITFSKNRYINKWGGKGVEEAEEIYLIPSFTPSLLSNPDVDK